MSEATEDVSRPDSYTPPPDRYRRPLPDRIMAWIWPFWGLVLFGGLAWALFGPTTSPTFMIQCVYDYEQTPENCRKILAGEDPPPLPLD